MEHGNVIVRFQDVTYGYDEQHPTLEEASFSVREDSKITLMGQNGAGKSTLFKLMLGELKPLEGKIHIRDNAKIAIGLQVMAKENLEKTVREYFEQAFEETKYDLDKRIKDVLEVVNLDTPLDKVLKAFSGGQLARLLLAYALIQEPDILLLDEPTNNLDTEGIEHLTGFLMMYPKTVIVISHDADFLNAFTEGVLHLDSYTHKVEQYVGNYYNVVEEIAARLERERMQNARMEKSIQDRKDKVNFFANKGGKMRKLASKLRDQIEEAEENMVDERQEDKTIREFTIPCQEYKEEIVRIKSVRIIKQHEPYRVEVDLGLRRGRKLLISGPNGIGKSTLLRHLADNDDTGAVIGEGVSVGYYRQDFSGLDFNQTVYESMAEVYGVEDKEVIYATAAQFLIPSKIMHNKIGSLSEGQKGLLCFARFVLQKPALLILDEPTNHINFRHLPVIAKALDAFEGVVIVVSHMPDFVSQITFNEFLDLSTLLKRAEPEL